MQRGFYKECYTYGKWGENLPFSGNDVDLMTGNRIPFCTSSSLLARTEIFLSSAAIGKNNPWLTIWFTDEARFIYEALSSRTFSQLLIFLNLLKDRWKKKVRLLTQWGSLEFIRFLFPFPLPGFEESTEGWKFAFPLEGWCPRPRAQTVRSQCRPILFFRCNKGNRATIKLINYFLDIKERLLVKENKRKKGCNFINRCTPSCYRLGIRFYSVSKIFQKNQEFLLYRRGMKHPLENTLPRSYRRVNETTAEGKLYYHWSK